MKRQFNNGLLIWDFAKRLEIHAKTDLDGSQTWQGTQIRFE